MKIYDGTSWQETKSLRVYSGSSWASAIKGWVYNNSSWNLAYPNFPSLISGPTFTYSNSVYPTVGTTWQINATWNSDPAYAPTSYTYKWYRSGVEISGANASTYTTTTSDVDKIISAQITATNGRGSTPVSQSTGVVILPTLSGLTASDSTVTPSASVSLDTPSNLLYSGSYSSTNATSVSLTTSNGSLSKTGTTSGNFSGSGSSAGQVIIYASPINTNKQVFLSWLSSPGATSYDVVKYGNNVTTTINVGSSTSYTWTGIADGNETNYFTVYPKTQAGSQGYGTQLLVTANNKTGSTATATANLVQSPPPSGGSASLSPAGTVQARTTISASTSGWSGSPTSYEIQIRKVTGSSPADENSGSQVAFSSSSSTSHVITDSEASGTPDQFAAFARAYNTAGGWSSWVKSNTVISTPYVEPVTTYTVTYNANGGSGGGSATFTAGSITLSATTPTRSGFTFNGWYDAPSGDYVYSVTSDTYWSPPSRNITMYARWSSVPTGSAPSITVSNAYDGVVNGNYQWTLTINNTSSTAASSYSWGVQFSMSNGGTVGASSTGSGGTIPANGSVTVTRNSATYTWARWVNVVASNSFGSSSTLSTSWA